MRYAGGKNKFANKLANVIGSGKVLVEPFIGGGAMTAALAPNFEIVYAYDNHPDLILMWQALLAGWKPPDSVSKEEYYKLKKEHSSALRGFAGFGCAFGGIWFAGYSVDLRSGRQNYAGEARRLLMKKVKRMKNVIVDMEDYRKLVIPTGAVIYADPPYANAVTYKNLLEPNGFDSNEFWQVASKWADDGATVFVSEFEAPDDWLIVWEEERNRSMRNTDIYRANTMVERLFCKG